MRVGYKGVQPQKECTGINRLIKGMMEELVEEKEFEAYYLGSDFLGVKKMSYIPDLYHVSDFENYRKELLAMAKVYDLDMIHSFFYPMGKMKGRGTVLTIHDLAALANPEWMTSNKIFDFFDKDLRAAAKEVDHIIADSIATKLDIQDKYQVEEERISVVYPGLYKESTLVTKDKKNDVRKKYGIKEPYILSVCTVQPRKNLKSLLTAFELYKDRKPTTLQLVICGASGWRNSDFHQQVSSSKYCDHIIFTNYVSNEDLDALYEEALMVAYVSYFEGFGLPVLEGLSKGKAVITSNISSMPEVGGNAACYANPYSVEEIADAIRRLAEDDLYRERLEKLALVQASKFSYKKAANETIEIYKKVGRLYE